MEISVTALAAIATIFLVVLTYSFNKNIKFTNQFNSLSNIIPIELNIAQIPTAFRFHGITTTDIKDVGITEQELAYLVASFTSGRIYHEINTPNCTKPFEAGTYRYKMCANESTRRAWLLVKKMMTESSYTKRIDFTINNIMK